PFATYFMMNGGSIIMLQRILGHTNLQQTLTYAHFAPDFLQDAIQYNPLKGSTELLV
ncbi:integrase, partial [Proteus columbae]|nr:integrase [Proteus columbae]